MMQRMVAVLLAAWMLVQAVGVPGGDGCTGDVALCGADPLQPDQGCTVLYATDGEWMLGGNNEDWYNPLTKVWFIPGEAGSFGRVYFGVDDYYPQGGMNDQGLFFDGLALETEMPVSMEGKEYGGNLTDRAMAECATVECVVGLFERYYMSEVLYGQFLFGDATGESAIVEADAVIRQRGGYQVATNFAQSTTSPEESGCWRYRTAVEGLQAIESLSVEAVRDVLDATHQSGPAQTLYSNVYDLKDKVVYLYYFHNFDEVVVLDLAEELARGSHAYDLPSLFPPNQAAEDWAEPRLRSRDDLITSRSVPDLDPEILQAYAGEYGILEGWGGPDQPLTVIAQERSLLLRLPGYLQVELFPESPTEFFHVTFWGPEVGIGVQARFGLDEEGRVVDLEFLYGLEAIRMDRLGPASFVPEVATPEPTATATQRPTVPATVRPTATLAAMPTATTAPPVTAGELALAAPTVPVVETVATPGEPDEGAGFPWAWLVVLVVVGVGAGWVVVRRRQ
jgi:hypothetical protein